MLSSVIGGAIGVILILAMLGFLLGLGRLAAGAVHRLWHALPESNDTKSAELREMEALIAETEILRDRINKEDQKRVKRMPFPRDRPQTPTPGSPGSRR